MPANVLQRLCAVLASLLALYLILLMTGRFAAPRAAAQGPRPVVSNPNGQRLGPEGAPPLVPGYRPLASQAIGSGRGQASARALRPQKPSQANEVAADPIDVIVILDDSGSMATCWPWAVGTPPFGPPCDEYSHNAPSDPNELRYSAARLLVHLADAADRIAVLRFDSAAEGLGALILLQEVGALENRRRLAASLQPPEDYAQRGYTRIDLGLREALRLLKLHPDPNRSQYVLLLTDGEPTAPLNAGLGADNAAQQRIITGLLAQIEEAGALLYPVILCNPDAGCAGDFLKTSSPLAREAKSSQDLLLIFSQLFADMKSDRSVVTRRNQSGALTLSIRKAHGARSIAFVSPRSALAAVERDGAPMRMQNLLDDRNIDLSLATELPAGEWVAQTTDLSAFAVVQADSYPELLFPPPSVHDHPASIRYYPAGEPPLVVVSGAGPAAAEPLLLDGATPLLPFGPDPLSGRAVAAHQLSGNPDQVTIQLGEDKHPLQLRRVFRLHARDDLPKAQIFSPSPHNPGIRPDGSRQIQIGFGPGLSVTDIQATVFISDITAGSGRAVYRKTLNCHHQLCSDDGFLPEDGRDYEALFLITALFDGLRFGHAVRTLLEVEPAINLRGLPTDIDLAKMPAEGWPLTVQAATVEEIGLLEAALILRRSDTSALVREVSLDFSVDVPEHGSQTALLHVDGLDRLRPGQYEGQLNLSAFSPAGLPMDVQIRPAPSLPVTLNIPRPQARIHADQADFGALLFDTSPNFRLDQEIRLPIAYTASAPFRLTVELTESSCPGLTAAVGDPQPDADGWALPVRLQSQAPMPPGSCHGILNLAGPNEDFDLQPTTIPFRLQIRDVEWSVAGTLDFGNLERAGEQATATLRLRFDGKTPFLLRVVGIAASAETGNDVIILDEQFLEAAPVEISGPPDNEGFFAVPITLVARKALPKDALRGAFYSGDLTLRIAGLDDQPRSVDISFRSPTLYQRYVERWLRPFYTFPLVLCSGPLLLLALLILVARARARGYNIEHDIDHDAEPDPAWRVADAAPQGPMTGVPWPETAPVPENAADKQDDVWDTAMARDPWSADRAAPRAPGAGHSSAPPTDNDDPWSSPRNIF